MSSRRFGPLALGVSVAALLAACAPATDEPATPTASAPTAPTPESTTEASRIPSASASAAPSPTAPHDVAIGLDAPWSVAIDGDAILISERDSGRILQLLPDGSTREAGVVADVVHGGEGGLLGLAFDDADRLYAYSTGPDGNRIQRFAIAGAPEALQLGEPETILDGLPAGSRHNGGRIAFGPDGMLYAAVGDAGDPSLAQDPSSLGGKILRMTPDGRPTVGNPDDQSLVYSSGHRNVQGLAWAADGTMFATEFGQDAWDELNRITAGGNYGWPTVEGAGGEGRGFVDPLRQWPTAEASPSGMAIVDGVILIANLRGERLRALTVAAPEHGADLHAGEFGRLRDVVVTPDGGIWIVTGNTDGRGTPRPGDDRIVRIDLPAG
ncbi:PQQ-dependent sugar dehydrogenase [Microbacterium sp. NPDC096154]|uniref:PQQ-dependent sugar dehydrogenase n=1 Tax=Microbacterium sp. NPDC096154 TaxID=3155549 RepID=UPI00332215AC